MHTHNQTQIIIKISISSYVSVDGFACSSLTNYTVTLLGAQFSFSADKSVERKKAIVNLLTQNILLTTEVNEYVCVSGIFVVVVFVLVVFLWILSHLLVFDFFFSHVFVLFGACLIEVIIDFDSKQCAQTRRR